ncbi:MAG: GNAT family N-acetyltransferase [Solirubrobacterales bacterium]|nr:GNAT family N-acetyltransferase [Solirubrobacterales bacterium]
MPADRPLGEPVEFVPVPLPRREILAGRHVILRPLDAEADAKSLYAVSHTPDGDPAIWTYLFEGPYESADDMRADLRQAEHSSDPLFFTVVPLPEDRPCGVASYLRMEPEFGVIEIGHIWFGAPMQRTTGATEAIYLLARHVFDDLGYRRLEWKCNALNAGSRRAAERFGFTFEGVFRQHMVIKGRNRDTAWYAIVDRDWPPIRDGFERWLDPANFDQAGRQRQSLTALRLRT